MQLSPATFAAFADLVHDTTGIALGSDKAYLLQHKLEPLAKANGLASFDELLQRLRATGPASPLRVDFIDAVTIHETSFFRDPEVYAAIGSQVLAPALTEQAIAARGRPFRIWSAATSTGQEAWSIAMLAAECLPPRWRGADVVSVLGTDISEHALATAQAGRYTAKELARGVSAERSGRHFARPAPGGEATVSDVLRSLVRFRQLNLIERPLALGSFDLVLCRNVLIYFDDATRATVVRAMAELLVPGGVLVLGAAESLYGLPDQPSPGTSPVARLFEAEYFPRAILYRRVAATSQPVACP